MHAATLDSLNRFARLGELELPSLDCAVRVPSRATATEAVSFEVVTEPGARVRAWLRWGDNSAPLEVDAGGQGSFVAERPGVYQVVAQASTDDVAGLIPRSAQVEASVDVRAPKVAIEVWPMVARGEVGSAVSFRWDIRHADRAELRAPLRDETVALPMRGSLEVELDAVAETFQLVATGMDGAEHVVEFATEPAHATLDRSLSETLKRLNRPWR